MTDQAVEALAPLVGIRAAGAAVGETRARYYRRRPQSPPPERPPRERRPQPRALSEEEHSAVLEVLHHPDHVDEAPATVYAKLLDEGTYLASTSTIYRILGEGAEVRERRRQAAHPAAVKPELVATGPNQCWSWDITTLLGPVKRDYFYLDVVIDIYRYVVGWMLARAELAKLAEALLADSVANQGVRPGQLIIHADRGTSMASKPVAFLLADLAVTKSHNRPHCSNDNPYSEPHCRTLRYRPSFPSRFGCFEDAHSFCRRFFTWYNADHRHSGIGFHTPADVHYGWAEGARAQRGLVLDAAYANHPERFVRKPPTPPALPEVAWINKPEDGPPAQYFLEEVVS